MMIRALMERLCGALAVLALVMVAGCQTTETGTSVLKRGTPFDTYKTFAWHPGKSAVFAGTAKQAFEPELVETLEATVTVGLLAKGFKEVPAEESDFLLAMIFEQSEQSTQARVDMPDGKERTKGIKTDFKVLRMVLRVLDTKLRQPVWEGWTRLETFGATEPDEQRLISLSIQQITNRFPP